MLVQRRRARQGDARVRRRPSSMHGADAGQEGRAARARRCRPTRPRCTSARARPTRTSSSTWAKGIDDAFSKDDAKAVVAMFADDGDYWINFSGAPATKGKKDAAQGARRLLQGRSRIRSGRPTNAWGIDGFAIVEHTMTGTHKGALGPLPAVEQGGQRLALSSTSCSPPPTGSSSTTGATRTWSRCWRRPARSRCPGDKPRLGCQARSSGSQALTSRTAPRSPIR